MRVLIVDDHALVRQGLRVMLELDDDIRIVGEASDSEMAIERAMALHPDVILMDIRIPGSNGINTVARIKRQMPQIAIVMLTMYDYDEYIIDSIKAGATGYVLKSSSREGLIKVMREVHAGRYSLPSEVLEKVMNALHREGIESFDHGDGLQRYHLTERQLDVLRLTIDGKTNRQIASSLYVTKETVKTHLRSIFKKLNVNSRAQAITIALRQKMLQ